MATDAKSLIDAGACYNNYSAQSWLMKLGLLRLIVLQGNPMADTSPQALLSASNCYNCYGPGVWPLMELALLQQIATGGGSGGGGSTQVYSTSDADPNVAAIVPADPTKGAEFYQTPSITLYNRWVWDVTAQTWRQTISP